MASFCRPLKASGANAAVVSLVGLTSLILIQAELKAVVMRPIRGGSTAPPTVVNPTPPPRPSQMVAGMNSGVLSTSTPMLLNTSSVTTTPSATLRGTSTTIRPTTDP